MSNVVPFNESARILEKVVVEGDLSQLSPAERLMYYKAVCESVGLNPLTRPFEYIYLNGRLVLYAKKDATDQLRRIHGISISITSRDKIGDVYVVTAKARTKDGREDEAIGAVSIAGLKNDALANALMKAESKAKRRVTLSIAGLGMLDETELETIPSDSIRYFQEEEPANSSVISIENKQKALPHGDQGQQPQQEQTVSSIQEFTLRNIKTGESKSGEPYMKIFVRELRLPILAKGEVLEEAKRIAGGEGAKITLETYEENGFVFLKRVIDGGTNPSAAAPSDPVESSAEEKTVEEDETPEKRYVLKKSEQGKTGNGTPFVRFVACDTNTGEMLTVIARGEEGLKLFESIPKDGTPFGMEVYEENKFLFLKKVVV